MTPAVIDNPILNSPFEEPTRHFRFTDDGITDQIVEERRLAGYFVPVPQPKKKGKQLALDTEWTQDRFKEAEFINRVRARVKVWRRQGWPGTTNTTQALLRHWSDPARERRLFFCQLEAVETAIYLTQVAPKQGDAWIETRCARPTRPREPRPPPHRSQDGDGERQDRRHGDADRVADAQQARRAAGRPLLGRVPRRHARHHDP